MMYQPFWFDQAVANERPEYKRLEASHNTDICIIGGGYTGLWTAIKIKQKQPELKVAILEAGLCGQGASGRNGGAMLTWSTKFPTLKRLYGTEQAQLLVQSSEQAVWQIRDFCLEHELEAEVRVDGAYYTATNKAQQGLLDPVMQQLSDVGLNHWQSQTPEHLLQKTGSALNLSGFYTPNAGSVHPGKLVRGLVAVAKQLGVEIFEHSGVKTEQGYHTKVVTEFGEMRYQKLVFATNSWMARQLPAFRRSILLVSSDMVITEPMPDTLEQLGLDHGASVIDSRTFVHYYRTTEDGRLMLGKGGNEFAFANKMHPGFDQQSLYQAQLDNTLQRFFPQHKMPVARSWNGASDRSVTGFPFFGQLDDKPVFYGLGYSGNGVVQTWLGGEILSSLVLAEDNHWSRCALVNKAIQTFPVEPLRYLGANMVRNAIRRKEKAEDAGLTASFIDCQLAKLAGNAGKADNVS